MSRHYGTSNFDHLDLRLLLKPAEGLLASLKGYYQDRSLGDIGTKLPDTYSVVNFREFRILKV